jgi:hypothetical protein
VGGVEGGKGEENVEVKEGEKMHQQEEKKEEKEQHEQVLISGKSKARHVRSSMNQSRLSR